MTTPPKGAVVINNQAVLEVSGELKNSFAITSKGDNDPHPITTILAAETNQDMGRWMKAIHSAIGASGGKAKDLKDLNAARKEEAMKFKEKGANSNNLRQLAKLDVEELRELPLRKLKEVRQHTASRAYKQAQHTSPLSRLSPTFPCALPHRSPSTLTSSSTRSSRTRRRLPTSSWVSATRRRRMRRGGIRMMTIRLGGRRVC